MALDLAPILRLKSIWAVSSRFGEFVLRLIILQNVPLKYKNSLDDLRKFVSRDGNFAAYRSLLKQSEAPGIPFMGRILSDVVLQKTVPAFRASPNDPSVKLVNFSRCRSLAAIMAGKLPR